MEIAVILFVILLILFAVASFPKSSNQQSAPSAYVQSLENEITRLKKDRDRVIEVNQQPQQSWNQLELKKQKTDALIESEKVRKQLEELKRQLEQSQTLNSTLEEKIKKLEKVSESRRGYTDTITELSKTTDPMQRGLLEEKIALLCLTHDNRFEIEDRSDWPQKHVSASPTPDKQWQNGALEACAMDWYFPNFRGERCAVDFKCPTSKQDGSTPVITLNRARFVKYMRYIDEYPDVDKGFLWVRNSDTREEYLINMLDIADAIDSGSLREGKNDNTRKTESTTYYYIPIDMGVNITKMSWSISSVERRLDDNKGTKMNKENIKQRIVDVKDHFYMRGYKVVRRADLHHCFMFDIRRTAHMSSFDTYLNELVEEGRLTISKKTSKETVYHTDR